jgi:hypothetical protein
LPITVNPAPEYTPVDIQSESLPDDVESLVKVVQGLLVHVFWAERYGLKLSPARNDEVNLRSFAEKFPILFAHDSSPVTTPRPLEKRLVGNCRDFSNFLAAFLRLKGIPARARCGFGTYLCPEHLKIIGSQSIGTRLNSAG